MVGSILCAFIFIPTLPEAAPQGDAGYAATKTRGAVSC